MDSHPSSADTAGAVIDAFYDAIAAGDIAAARDCCDVEALFWHSFDGRVLTLEQISGDWAQLVEHFPQRAFVDRRRAATAEGFIQQHMMVARTNAGDGMAWAACMVIRLRRGQILRLDEYIDPAGLRFAGEPPTVTPGLPPPRGAE